MREEGQGEHDILAWHMDQQCTALAVTYPLHLQQGAPADIIPTPFPTPRLQSPVHLTFWAWFMT